MKTTVLLALAALTPLAVPAAAQSLVPNTAAGRYQMQPVGGGVARLDTVSGEMSLCRIEDGSMSCEPSEEDRERLEARIRELSDGAAERPGEGRAPPAARRLSPDGADEDAEIDKAMERMKRIFRTFRDLAREFDDPAPADSLPDRT